MALTIISSSSSFVFLSSSPPSLPLSYPYVSISTLQRNPSPLLSTTPMIAVRTDVNVRISFGSLSSRANFFCCASPASSSLPAALLFDCDGVLVDTEKDGHRISFNDTFAEDHLLLGLCVERHNDLGLLQGGRDVEGASDFGRVGWVLQMAYEKRRKKGMEKRIEAFPAIAEIDGVHGSHVHGRAHKNRARSQPCNPSRSDFVANTVHCPNRASKI